MTVIISRAGILHKVKILLRSTIFLLVLCYLLLQLISLVWTAGTENRDLHRQQILEKPLRVCSDNVNSS